ncbi:MAG TPA: amidohydrolase [Candidatus Krumholzibacteria bacterium]|nr:amidohydrolase [Candidatus Krumholzibacteria bacterium]
MRRIILLLILLLPASAFADADLVLYNASVWTGTSRAGATCIAAAAGNIIYVGDDAGAASLRGPATRGIDLHGALVVPGLVDAHAHVENLGRLLGETSLVGTGSREDVARLVHEAQSRAAPGAWIHGRGWDQNDWADRTFPTWKDLAGTDANPVYLDRIDGHALWVNREALRRCGIGRETPDPPGGRILRDANGDPTGILIDNATNLVTERVPRPAGAELDARLRRALEECSRLGLTGVHDAGSRPEVIDAFRRLGERGQLAVNVYAMLDSEYPDAVSAGLAAGPLELFGGRLIVRCVKLRADGALGSRGAALLAPYDDDPGNSGLLVTEPDALLAFTRDALAAGFQVATHAIGDRGNRITLDLYERALAASGARDARLRIEHCQILAPSDIPRFAALGVVASMQPTHATSDMPWVRERIGESRQQGGYVWRSLLDSGAVLAFGSDAPVESIDPLWGIYAAVTREDRDGQPPEGWMPEQRVTVVEALRAFTWGAAYAAFDEMHAGTIATGMRADVTVIDRNILSGAAADLRDARVRMTVVRGVVVFDGGD